MTLDLRWSIDAERDLLALPPSQAERVLEQLEQFARTGHGFVRMLLDGSAERRLYVEGYYLVLGVAADEVVHVYRVHPR